ncbi:MAG: response regulator [Candidatus Omnitrophica bacterium]|nr:response regulator [Candidatus Omnitrophota bacterium]
MKTILIVDDQTRIRQILGRVLMNEGFHVIKAKDAMQAQQVLKEGKKVDLMLLDINMPQVQGDTLYDVVQAFHYRTKVIVCSVLPMDEQSKKIPGAVDYYDKTDDLSILLKKIEEVFKKEENAVM